MTTCNVTRTSHMIYFFISKFIFLIYLDQQVVVLRLHTTSIPSFANDLGFKNSCGQSLETSQLSQKTIRNLRVSVLSYMKSINLASSRQKLISHFIDKFLESVLFFTHVEYLRFTYLLAIWNLIRDVNTKSVKKL